MKKTILIIAMVFLFTSFENKTSNLLNGKRYIGFEVDRFSHGSPEIFQTILTFKNDSVLVLRNLISINGKDTLNFKDEKYSCQYKGIVKIEKNKLEFVAYAYQCENCPEVFSVVKGVYGEPLEVFESKQYKGTVGKKLLHLNGIDFRQK